MADEYRHRICGARISFCPPGRYCATGLTLGYLAGTEVLAVHAGEAMGTHHLYIEVRATCKCLHLPKARNRTCVIGLTCVGSVIDKLKHPSFYFQRRGRHWRCHRASVCIFESGSAWAHPLAVTPALQRRHCKLRFTRDPSSCAYHQTIPNS